MKIAASLMAMLLSLTAAANEPAPFRQGELLLRTGTGRESIDFRYRLKQERMRIDRPGEIIPAPPVNLLDLASGTLRILHPHNATWQEVAAVKRSQVQPGPRQFPAIAPPLVPAVPRMPDLARPSAPPLPRLPFLQGGTPELKATGEECRIHGYACARHTITFPHEGEMILWLASPGIFPPFHLLLSDVPQRQARDPFSQVPALLRERKLFPLLAEWKGEDGRLITRWEVLAITPGTVLDDSLFEIPETFHRIDGN